MVKNVADTEKGKHEFVDSKNKTIRYKETDHKQNAHSYVLCLYPFEYSGNHCDCHHIEKQREQEPHIHFEDQSA